MTKKIRKIHLYSWLVLIVTIPVILVYSVLGINESLINDEPIKDFETTSIIASIDNETFFVGTKKLDALKSLKIIVKKPIKSPSAIVYGMRKSNRQLLGQLNEKGIYNFEIPTQFDRLLIIDNIKDVELLNTELRWE